jgi:PqqD family protein of HPr-rel-A system
MSETAGGDASARWRMSPHVLMRAWNGEVVAYNDVTGHTHHFMDLAAWTFEHLSMGAMAEGELMAAAAAELEPEPGSDLETSVRNSLLLLQRLSLLEAASAG